MTSLILAASVVLYNNDLDLLRKNLTALKHQAFDALDVDIRLGLIDNTEGTQLEAAQSIAQSLDLPIQVAIASPNIGFGAGHNRLFREFKGLLDYYLCVNPDGLPHYRLVERLLRFSQTHSDQGIFEARQFPTEHPKVYDLQRLTTDWCSGCCLLIPRAIYETTGGFDEDFFLYCEDVDLSWRVQLAGYHCFTVSDAWFHHYVHGVERDLSNQQKQMAISMYKLAVKYGHQPATQRNLAVIQQILSKQELKEVLTFRPEQSPPALLPDFIKFDHAASYAEVRW
jgi:N-acetylglucosaminyl-diphospho-decaprenol L-rhamnosyltransferase